MFDLVGKSDDRFSKDAAHICEIRLFTEGEVDLRRDLGPVTGRGPGLGTGNEQGRVRGNVREQGQSPR